jgi:polyribonucleotide nucleotidyltransferase
MTVHTVEVEIAGQKITLETGRMARLCAGAVLITQGDTLVLCTSVTGPGRPGIDFLPLTIDYREKPYAAGKIPGGFFKREGRPTTKEIITMRLTDRSVRPLFPKGFRDEVQCQCFVLSHDQVNDSDIMALNGASAALTISKIPFAGPVGCVRVGHVDGELVLNPTLQQLEESAMDLVVAGTAEALTMVEGSANELPEDVILEALKIGHVAVQKICAAQVDLAGLVGTTKAQPAPLPEDENLENELREKYASAYREKLQTVAKNDRSEALGALKKDIRADMLPDPDDAPRKALLSRYMQELKKKVHRSIVLEDGHRIDGRTDDEIRQITCEVALLPRTHGSALFTRGETQALVTATLGTSLDEQRIEGLTPEVKKHFMLHYNFPPFCVNEARFIRGPGRREIGHGNLAERAIEPILPNHEDFAYTIRVVSDVLMSNGSSSMATVCGATLSLMDAGVTIKQPVAGIAMGLMKDGDNIRILSDILGDEDACGDMDFKVAGSQKGITALQMDIKVTGLSEEVLERALAKARQGRIHILKKMLESLQRPREEISEHAPRMCRIQINKEKIGSIIGPGGKMIRALQEEFETKIDIEDDGTVMIFGVIGKKVEECKQRIEDMTQEAEVDKIYEGKVVSIKEFGAFVELAPGLDGLVHVSELSDGYVDKVEEVVNLGDLVRVKCISIDDSGRVKLSRKAVMVEEGKTDGRPERPAGAGPRPSSSSSSGPSRGRDAGRGGSRGGSRGGDSRGRGGDSRGRGGRGGSSSSSRPRSR